MRFCRLHVSVIVIALMVVAASAVFMQVPASADNSDASDAIRLEETNWIWTPRAKESFSLLMRFRKSFTVDGELSRAQLVVTGDRTVTAYVNGERIGSSAEWSVLQVYDITEYLTEGENVVSAVVTANLTSGSSDGGLLAQIVLKDTAGRTTRISTDETWQVTDAIPRGNSWMIPASMGGGDAGVEWDFADLISSYDDSKWGVLALGGAYKHPEYSEFKGEYLQAHYADYYKDYLRINETTGLMERNGQVFRPFFAIYNQASTAGSELSILKWDFDQLEEDLKIMERNQIHPYIRFFSWSELLNPDGTWKVVSDQPKGSDLPRFRYNYEIYDYFLDRVQAHGLYVMAEIPLYWGINYDVIPEEYRGAYIVIDEYWDKMVEAYTRIIDYYSKRTVIAMFMIGEEGLVFDTGILTNPHKNATEIPETQSKFAAYLESKYGTVDAMKQAWGSGYDCSSKQSEWSVQYPYTAEAFDYISEFSDVKVPVFEQRTYNENVLRDPVVIDLMEFKQWLIVEQCNKWAESVRKVDPNHILFYCNAHDFNPSWHFIHAFDRARFAFDLIGVG
ncbi:MAG: alpha-L-rhamnosidase N-terminal domain-containing protein, partial [Bacillota bacterium]